MNSKVYLVGGAVRDKLLGRVSKDNDYVVVGSTPEKMIADGFTQVGASFPVFLHPTTGDEYALARTERKTGAGYHGFDTVYDPSVTLEDDLARRDLTINSMALSETGELIDPYGGQQDLSLGILRHTSEAFAEDPLRVLRLARFAARYGFYVADETIDLAIKVVASGELKSLPLERIWTELYKGFSEPHVIMMLDVLDEVGALKVEPLTRYFGDLKLFGPELLLLDLTQDPNARVLLSMPRLASLADKELLELRVPNEIRQALKLEKIFTEALTSVMDDERVHSVLKLTRFVTDESFPDTRLALSVSRMKVRLSKLSTLWENNHEKLFRAALAIRALDMATIVASGDMKTVKERVDRAKLDAVKVALS